MLTRFKKNNQWLISTNLKQCQHKSNIASFINLLFYCVILNKYMSIISQTSCIELLVKKIMAHIRQNCHPVTFYFHQHDGVNKVKGLDPGKKETSVQQIH